MKKCSTDTCCLTLPLKLEKWQEDRLAKRFELARQIYNTKVHAELKKLKTLEHSEQYQEIQEQLRVLTQKEHHDKEKLRLLYKARDELLKSWGFSEYGFKENIKYYYIFIIYIYIKNM